MLLSAIKKKINFSVTLSVVLTHLFFQVCGLPSAFQKNTLFKTLTSFFFNSRVAFSIQKKFTFQTLTSFLFCSPSCIPFFSPPIPLTIYSLLPLFIIFHLSSTIPFF